MLSIQSQNTWVYVTTHWGSKRWALDLPSQLWLAVKSSLMSPWTFCIEGQPKTLDGIYPATLAMLQAYADQYVDINPQGLSLEALASKGADTIISTLEVTPIDPSGRTPGLGMITDRLGAIPWANGSLQYAGLPPLPNA